MTATMGMYDRDYQHHQYGQQPGMHLRAPQSMTVKLIILTSVIYILQMLFDPHFTDLFALHVRWYEQPWRVFELLTYGFMHSPADFKHLLFNMLALWFFGKSIEEKYGKQEFLAIYLVALIFAAICWNVSRGLTIPEALQGIDITNVGASGAISAVLLLFAFNYPNATVHLFMLFPAPAWAAGIIWVLIDAMGSIQRGDNVAYTAHLGGFLFAYLYYKYGWRIMDWVPANLSMPNLKRRPPLKVHRPAEDEGDTDREADEVDRILQKINDEGQDSLTAKERRTLERASRIARKKRK